MQPLIVAPATPVGHSAIALVRLSGAGLDAVLKALCGRIPADRRPTLVRLRDPEVFDDAMLTVFRSPRSYTGEDVAELSCHGNPLIVERLLNAAVTAGARLASPGEFTRRALLNGRVDLIGAEAIAATIAATSAQGLALARGEDALRARVAELREAVLDVAAELEASVDYPGEGLIFEGDTEVRARLVSVAERAEALAGSYRSSRVALEGATVALIGPVNAGKSSLFNALLGRARALVSPTPGTTRDVVESALHLPGGRILLLDTAGERVSDDAVEAQGIAFGQHTASDADLRLHCYSAQSAGPPAPPPGGGLVVATHCDVAPPGFTCDHAVSSVTGQGVAALADALLPAIVGASSATEAVLTSARQRDVMMALAGSCREAAAILGTAGPVVALAGLHAALRHADAFDGTDTTEAVLDRLFLKFCVGK